MAHYEDLYIDQGSDFRMRLNLVDNNGNKRDLSGYSVNGLVKRSYDDDSASATPFATALIFPPTDGGIQISLTNLQTDAFNHRKRYVYDIEISKDSDGYTSIERVMEGQVIVRPSVTR